MEIILSGINFSSGCFEGVYLKWITIRYGSTGCNFIGSMVALDSMDSIIFCRTFVELL